MDIPIQWKVGVIGEVCVYICVLQRQRSREKEKRMRMKEAQFIPMKF